MEGGAFDNNILCIGEKEIFVVESVADELKRSLLSRGCVELDRGQIDSLTGRAFTEGEGDERNVNREFVGRNPNVLAERHWRERAA